jgi:hypothetical protein
VVKEDSQDVTNPRNTGMNKSLADKFTEMLWANMDGMIEVCQEFENHRRNLSRGLQASNYAKSR